MKTTIETIRNGLASQLADLEQDLETATTQVSQLRSSRRQVVAALKALGGQDTAGGQTPAAPKKAQVRQAIESLLADNGNAIAQADLEGLVAEKVATDYGCSAVGLALRLREILASAEFLITEDQVRSRPTEVPQ